MANISASIELYDRLSAPINNMIGAMNNMIGAYHSLDRAMDNGFDESQIREAEDAVIRTQEQVDRLGDYIEDNEDHQEDFNDEVEKGSSAADGLIDKIAGLAAAYVGFSQLSEAIDFASDLQEVQNVVDVAFGNSASKINEWATTTLNAFGLNELSAKKFAGTMGAMLKSSGLSGDAVADMSMRITELAGDMASFYNLEGQEAFDKLRAGISGETEPLKQLGINMSVANLEAFALSQGIKKSYNEMSQAEQVMLRYNYLLQATQDAQGDFGRTSDSFSNQQKLLTENWKAFTGELAGKLLPALSSGLVMLNNLIGFVAENWETIEPIVLGIATAVGLYTAALVTYNTIEAVSALIKGISAAATMMSTGATFAATAAQHGFNAALLACPLTWIVIAIIAVIVAIVIWIKKVGGLKVAWLMVVNALLTAWDWVKIGFFTGVYWVINLWEEMQYKFKSVGTAIANFMGDMKANVMMILQNMVNGAIKIINGFIETLNMIPGVSIGAIAEVTFGTNAQLENEAAKQARNAELADYRAELDANEAERNNKLEQMKADAYAATASRQAEINAAKVEAANDDSSTEEMLGEVLGGDVAATASNTGAMADSMEIANEDLKYLRDIAEQETVNRFTTAEIKVDMTNNNNISQGMDLDGVIDYLANGVNEAMEKAAEGVHE